VVAAALVSLALAGPVLVHDRDERSPATSVAAATVAVPGREAGDRGAVAYARTAPSARGGTWVQFWLFFAANPQDRGILRTGRHAGDWELVQYRLDAAGRPVEAVYAQHSGAERCGWADVERRGGRPVVYLAAGSHAAYFRPGVRDRTFPDPNDEADGRGAVARPRVEAVARGAPAWMRWPGRWGGARAGWVPGEMDSPRGPAFQPQGRWSDPDAWARRARPCTRDRCDARGECDGAESAMTAGTGLAAAALLLLVALRRRRR
jgi:MYXO-CTERM domain-containing protein